MKLNITSVRFKNFFSYGAKEQSFELKDGISFIVGQDLDRGSSNGSGKCLSAETLIDIEIDNINILNDLQHFLEDK